MGLIQEAKNRALNLLGKPFSVALLPKDKLQNITVGGPHVDPEESEMVLFNEGTGMGFPTRNVTVYNPDGSRKIFEEVVSPAMTGQNVTVYKK